MKKAKILAVLGVLLAMGITACNGGGKSEDSKSEGPVPSESSSEAPSTKSSSEDKSSSSSSSSVDPGPQKDATGHIWGADADIAGDAENGLAAYKRAVCSEGDNAVKYTVNQSVVKYDKGGRKSGTPEGYTKLNANGDIMSFKFNSDKYLKGKLYLFGCMDGYSSNYEKNFCYYQGAPNVEVKVNGDVVDISAQADVTFQDIFGTDTTGDNLSYDNYALLGDIVLQKGVNEIIYKRVATLNILIKDFVFVGEELDGEWDAGQDVAAGEGTVAYKKFNSLFDANKTKIEFVLGESMLDEGAENKNDPAGYLKLKSNNQSFSFAFAYDKAAIGYVYQRGVMDGWAANNGRDLFSGGTNGADDFEMKVNDEIVDLSKQKQLKFNEALPGEAQEGDLSPLTDVETGVIALVNGNNTFTFKRLASFNLALTHIVFIITNTDHAHTVATDLSYDNVYHFNTCSDANCPVAGDYRKNVAKHEFAADPSKPDTPSTCAVHGAKHEICACGLTRDIELPFGDHNFTEGTPVTNSAGQNVTPLVCSACNQKGFEMNLTDCDGASNIASDGKVTNGATLKWKFKVGEEVGTVSFAMHARLNGGVSSSGAPRDNAFNSGYVLKAGAKEGTATAVGKQLGATFGATVDTAVWFEMGQVAFAADDVDANGEIEISITFPTQDYRHRYTEAVRIIFVA